MMQESIKQRLGAAADYNKNDFGGTLPQNLKEDLYQFSLFNIQFTT